MKQQKQILALFDYVARTGFGTVSKNIVKELKRSFGDNLKIDIVAVNYFGEPYQESENVFVVPAKTMDVQQDDFGRFFFLKALKENNYDGVFICQDLGVICPFIEIMQHIKAEKKEQNRKTFKSIYYFPVDCGLVKELTKNLDFFDVLVTYTEYGRKEVLRFKPELKTKLKVIPHGNNSKDFYPIESREEINKFRLEYFGENANKFIITNLNRNQPRKDIPNTIFGFIEAKANWDKSLPEPFLYLHCHPNDPMGWDIRGIMLQTDLVEDVDYKLLPKEYEDTMVDVSVVNKIYNASDAYLTTTLGEGWGLGFSEAASCKIPVIAPYSTSFKEMSGYGKNAFMLENLYPYCNFNDNVIRQQTDIYEIADKLLEVAQAKFDQSKVKEKQVLIDKVERNYKWIKSLEWAEVCKQWKDYFLVY